MAIAFDSASFGSGNSSSPITFSHTMSASANGLLIVLVGAETGAGGGVSGCSYNGVAMTQYSTGPWNVTGQTSSTYYLFYLFAPSSGTNTVSVSPSGTASVGGMSMSYTGVAQTGFPDAFAGFVNGSPNTRSVTTIADNSWTILFATGDSSPTASTGSTARNLNVTQRYGGSRGSSFDSNGAITPAASHSMAFGGAANGGSLMLSIAPFTAPLTNGAPLMFM